MKITHITLMNGMFLVVNGRVLGPKISADHPDISALGYYVGDETKQTISIETVDGYTHLIPSYSVLTTLVPEGTKETPKAPIKKKVTKKTTKKVTKKTS